MPAPTAGRQRRAVLTSHRQCVVSVFKPEPISRANAEGRLLAGQIQFSQPPSRSERSKPIFKEALAAMSLRAVHFSANIEHGEAHTHAEFQSCSQNLKGQGDVASSETSLAEFRSCSQKPERRSDAARPESSLARVGEIFPRAKTWLSNYCDGPHYFKKGPVWRLRVRTHGAVLYDRI
jgi:hypothetical protein